VSGLIHVDPSGSGEKMRALPGMSSRAARSAQ
jgi:hypothetical protein